MVLLVEVQGCCCCSLRKGVQVLVVLLVFLQFCGAALSQSAFTQVQKLSKNPTVDSLTQAFFKSLVVPCAICVVNSLYNFCVYTFAAYVVLGSEARLRGMQIEMQRVRSLWLSVIVTDVLVPVPLIVAYHSDEWVIHTGLAYKMSFDVIVDSLIQFAFAMFFFIFVDSLNAKVQAGETEKEEALVGEPGQASVAGDPATKAVPEPLTPEVPVEEPAVMVAEGLPEVAQTKEVGDATVENEPPAKV